MIYNIDNCEQKILKIPSIDTYYNFQTVGPEMSLKSTIYSFEKDLYDIKTEDQINKAKIQIEKEIVVQNNIKEINTIRKKD